MEGAETAAIGAEVKIKEGEVALCQTILEVKVTMEIMVAVGAEVKVPGEVPLTRVVSMIRAGEVTTAILLR